MSPCWLQGTNLYTSPLLPLTPIKKNVPCNSSITIRIIKNRPKKTIFTIFQSYSLQIHHYKMAKEGKEDKLPTLKVTFCPGLEKNNRETLLTQNAKKPGTWFMCKKKKLLLKINSYHWNVWIYF